MLICCILYLALSRAQPLDDLDCTRVFCIYYDSITSGFHTQNDHRVSGLWSIGGTYLPIMTCLSRTD